MGLEAHTLADPRSPRWPARTAVHGVLITATVVAGLVGLLLLPGGDSQPAQPAEFMLAAAGTTADVGSFRVAIDTSLDAAGERVSVRGEGLFALEPARGRLVFESTVGSFEMLAVGPDLYLRPPDGSGLPPGKRWLRVDAHTAGFSDALGQIGTLMPEFAFDQLGGAEDVTVLGRDRVRGVSCTHYSFVTVFDRAVLDVAAGSGVELATDRISAEAWVDDDGLLRRLSAAFEFLAMGQAARVEVTMEFWDFGVDVEIDAPPEDEVLDYG